MDKFNRASKVSKQGRFATKPLLYNFRKISQFRQGKISTYPYSCHEDAWGSRGLAPVFLILHISWKFRECKDIKVLQDILKPWRGKHKFLRKLRYKCTKIHGALYQKPDTFITKLLCKLRHVVPHSNGINIVQDVYIYDKPGNLRKF
jgi:hypothetical protein